MPLTDTRVQTLTTGNRNERLVVDTNGLYLRLRKGKGGITRAWQFRRREGGKLSIAAIGTYPKMSLKEARLRAAELAARRDLACPTVTEAAEQWLAERVNTTHRRAFLVEGYIRRAVLPALGSHRLRDVMPSEIGKMVRDYRDRGGQGEPGQDVRQIGCPSSTRGMQGPVWHTPSPMAGLICPQPSSSRRLSSVHPRNLATGY